jgi:hypothetical protein
MICSNEVGGTFIECALIRNARQVQGPYASSLKLDTNLAPIKLTTDT